ncbi:MAG TPA: LLM class flavin-dependent oxidoreductase [Candidatus Limnocylindrales bacterium]|nr:LLM class flavin-dependent oxidoreductase [Candidatus Limnocylindrales bacterium]
MAGFEVGVVIQAGTWGPERQLNRWSDIRAMILRAEEMGFDTVWFADELVWFFDDKPPLALWDAISIIGAAAAITSRIKIGTWVISALHRNPGITAKIVETVDEISDGRFVFGLGAGHAWPGQAHAFGLPEDRIFDRFDEALQVMVPLLREGKATFEGQYHAARDLPQIPHGPRPNRIPLMLGVLGPRGQRLAAKHADIWSCYSNERTDMVEFAPLLEGLEAACAEVGRDPRSIGRSAGVDVKPLEPEPHPEAAWIGGTPEQQADQIRALIAGGFTQVELFISPPTLESLEACAPVLELLRAGAA